MIRNSSNRILLSGVPVDPVTPEELADTLVAWSDQARPRNEPPKHISYVNAHVHNLARANNALRSTLRNTSLCYADGASVVWACRRFGANIPPRLTAADFLPNVLRSLTEADRRVFFLAGAPNIANRAIASLQESVPNFSPAGIHHGYFAEDESSQVVAEINAARPDVLIVGMGTPRQELWVDAYRDTLQVPVVWTVGALLDYFAGTEKRCPRWMGDNGLEWLYRLMMHPRRMASRYLIGNPQFVAAMLRGKLEHVA
jgi:N-acetylglucosaminyldiphosphoundecaprenol N-acetyl-beta-D-mannosaminyltransferase